MCWWRFTLYIQLLKDTWYIVALIMFTWIVCSCGLLWHVFFFFWLELMWVNTRGQHHIYFAAEFQRKVYGILGGRTRQDSFTSFWIFELGTFLFTRRKCIKTPEYGASLYLYINISMYFFLLLFFFCIFIILDKHRVSQKSPRMGEITI